MPSTSMVNASGEPVPADGNSQPQSAERPFRIVGDIYAIRLPYWAPSDTYRRLRRFLDYVHHENAVFSLAQVPTQAMWGTPPANRVLCDPAVNLPIRIWVLGTLAEISGTVSDGELVGSNGPQSTTVLRVRLLRAADGVDMARLIVMGRRRPWFDGDVFECGISYRSAWDSQRMFAEVYDATQAFRSKGLMNRMPLSDLVRGDVVLVECYCVRSPELANRRVVAPATWRVWFELSAISLLVKAPRLPPAYIPDSFTGCL